MTTDVYTRSPFVGLLPQVDYLLSTDRRRARSLFRKALSEATSAENAFIDRMAEMFARHPYEHANKWLTALAFKEPDMAELIEACAPRTDPGLYWRRQAGLDPVEVSFEQAEMPRWSIRQGGPRDLAENRVPSRAIDRARLDPGRIAARVARRPVPYVRSSMELARQRWVDDLMCDYADTRMFVCDEDQDSTALDHPVIDGGSENEPTGWDRLYYRHVFDSYGEGMEWDGSDSHIDKDQIAAEARALLQAAGDLPIRGRTTRRTTRRPRWKISDAEREKFAKARTGMKVTDDVREEIPYQGNGVDDIHSAMRSVAGWRCVSCFIERAMADLRPIHSRNGVLSSDDGLCDHCRADGRPGIPPLEGQFTFEQFVLSRCEYLADTYPQAAPALLAEVYRRAAPHPICRIVNRFCFQRFGVLAAPQQPQESTTKRTKPSKTRSRRAPLGAGQRHARCDGCFNDTVINHDGYCTSCRIELGLYKPDTADSSVA